MRTNPPLSGKPVSPARFDTTTLNASLTSFSGASVSDVVCTPLLGDASDRSYFRVTYRTDAADNPSASTIVMQLQAPVPHGETDFIRILKFLNTLQLPVPALFNYDAEKGLLFLEDCGHTTLEDWIREHPEDTAAYYRQAVELLASLHQRATKNSDADCPAFHLKFDVEKLMWELDFMLEHYVNGLCKSSLSACETEAIREQFLFLSETLAAQEPTFTHRDYHSRNLMAHEGRLILLDFQDARMGPCQYDLASLLKDSYVRLDDNLRTELIEHFIRQKEKEEARSVNRQEFLRIFEWMSIQRNLKAVGTFAYQSVVKNKHRYLEYIPTTLAYVRQSLNTQPELSELKQILTRYLPGLASEKAQGK
jgi:N-acetylmuramate 1-kinase